MDLINKNPTNCGRSVVVDSSDPRYVMFFREIARDGDIPYGLGLAECKRWPFLPSTFHVMTGESSVVLRNRSDETINELKDSLGHKCRVLCEGCEMFTPIDHDVEEPDSNSSLTEA